MKRLVHQLLICAICFIAIASSANAQTVTGSLVGHVEDASGAVISGARVVITEINRGATREIVTNDEGNYSFGSLEPGIYRVEVTQANFKKLVQENVEVAINTTVRIDGKL
ncbi:MAG: carboxypeptidase regulatory-like domain-containing protein, partial [Pyrinomonadaceae bacterium]|nr:carboxypeptidase regulatory-like domain-containing protein [Pyrinomonadaceae bacterium]